MGAVRQSMHTLREPLPASLPREAFALLSSGLGSESKKVVLFFLVAKAYVSTRRFYLGFYV